MAAKLARRGNPSQMLERFGDELDRMFEEFGFGRGWMAPRRRRRWLRLPWRSRDEEWTFEPDIDVFQRGNEIVIRADLPGLKKDEIQVDVTEDSVSIRGERKREYEEERDGVYWAERSYGRFLRVIPLPEGAMTDQAKATFRNGVLEIRIPAPPEEVSRGRRIEIEAD
jgi:HSP20 family protein